MPLFQRHIRPLQNPKSQKKCPTGSEANLSCSTQTPKTSIHCSDGSKNTQSVPDPNRNLNPFYLEMLFSDRLDLMFPSVCYIAVFRSAYNKSRDSLNFILTLGIFPWNVICCEARKTY